MSEQSGSLNLNDNLDALSNVFINNPIDTEVLTYQSATNLWINQAGGGGGEANTSSNVGTGEGLALAKVGVDLPFKSLIGEANRIILTGNANDVTFTLGNQVVLNNQNNDFGAFYQDLGEIAVPANPAINVRRLFVDSATGELSVRTNAGATVSLEAAGGEVFAWTADHDANGFALEDARFADDTDNTKIIDLNLVGMTTGITAILDFNFTTAKTITFPDATTTIVGIDITDQLTNTELTLGVFAKITGVGVLTQALDMNGNNIILDVDGDLRIDLTDDDVMELYNNTISPNFRFMRDQVVADETVIGKIIFRGLDNASVDQNYARIEVRVNNDVAGAEDGAMKIKVTIAGVETTMIDFFGGNNDIDVFKDLDMAADILMGGNDISLDAAGNISIDNSVANVTKLKHSTNFPNFALLRDQLVADGSTAGKVSFRSKDDVPNERVFGEIRVIIEDTTVVGNLVHGSLHIRVMDANVETTYISFNDAKSGQIDILKPTLFADIVTHSARNLEDKGADVASPAGGIMTLGGDGNFFDITGTNTINEIVGTAWQAGAEIVLQFDAVLTIINNSGGTNDILTGDGSNITTSAGFILGLRFNGTDWLEVFRNSVSAGGGASLVFAKVIKKADETVNSSTTLQNDDELFFTPTINKIYYFQFFAYFESGVTPDFKNAFTVPSGATIEIPPDFDDWQNAAGGVPVDGTIAQVHDGQASVRTLSFWGKIIMAGNAGNVNYQWAQNVSDAGDTKVLKGSTIIVYEENA